MDGWLLLVVGIVIGWIIAGLIWAIALGRTLRR